MIDLDFRLDTEPVELPSEILAVIGGTCTALLEVKVGSETELCVAPPSVVSLEGGHDPVARLLHDSLGQLPVVGRLRNLTSGAHSDEDPERDEPGSGPAQAFHALGPRLFPTVEQHLAQEATDSLLELTSMARRGADPPLLAARVHSFFRGLPGLWACADPSCSAISRSLRARWGGELPPTGALYPQPRRNCQCGARVFEVHTCRGCGTAFFKAYALDSGEPDYLWTEDVGEVDGEKDVVKPLYLLLEAPPAGSGARFQYLDPVSGRLGSGSPGVREVWLPMMGDGIDHQGMFANCPRCKAGGVKSITDHVTKGDEPFQGIISAQLLEQPPRLDVYSPLHACRALYTASSCAGGDDPHGRRAARPRTEPAGLHRDAARHDIAVRLDARECRRPGDAPGPRSEMLDTNPVQTGEHALQADWPISMGFPSEADTTGNPGILDGIRSLTALLRCELAVTRPETWPGPPGQQFPSPYRGYGAVQTFRASPPRR